MYTNGYANIEVIFTEKKNEEIIMDIQKMKDLIEQKKLRGSNRKPRYATRKLTIGLVSCMLGFTLLVSPSSVLADEVDTTSTELAESVETTEGQQGQQGGRY